jgi:glycosyltransferase involved in cell wall biosynthesis
MTVTDESALEVVRMSSYPLVSIVLPTHNGARYLRDAIDSCIAQTYKQWELIVVDDASTDDTPCIIADYVARDGRISSVRNLKNCRLPGSLNRGFARARGELFTWTSDDNIYRPHALENMVGFLLENPDIALVYTDFSEIDEAGQILGSGLTGPVQELALGCVIGACFLYRRVVDEQLGGYDESMFLVEDYDFWLRASTRFKLARLEQDLYMYRRHSQSLTQTRPEEVREALERCWTKHLPRLDWMSVDIRERAYWNLEFVSRERQALRELTQLLPKGCRFVLVDEQNLWRYDQLPGKRIPFLERNGEYWGMPTDDIAAIQECERLREAGAEYIVFAWPSFWSLDYYSKFQMHLRSHYRCILENERLVVFALYSQGDPSRTEAMEEHVIA